MPQPYPNGELVVVIDCSDLGRSAEFWAAVLGYTPGPASAGLYRGLTPESGAGIDLLLQRVPDAADPRARRGGRLALVHPGRPGRQRVLRPAAAGRLIPPAGPLPKRNAGKRAGSPL